MKSSIVLPALFFALLAAGCDVTERTTEDPSSTVTTTAAGETAPGETAPAPSDQIAEGAQQVGEGLQQAGRGVAQATGEALQSAGRELQEAAGAGDDPSGAAAPATTPGSAAAGGRVYVAKACDGCHGVNGGGGTAIARRQNVPPLGSPAVKGQSDTELVRILTQGKTAASAAAHKSKNLTPQEVNDLIAWIRSL